jgi:hypothetical protein
MEKEKPKEWRATNAICALENRKTKLGRNADRQTCMHAYRSSCERPDEGLHSESVCSVRSHQPRGRMCSSFLQNLNGTRMSCVEFPAVSRFTTEAPSSSALASRLCLSCEAGRPCLVFAAVAVVSRRCWFWLSCLRVGESCQSCRRRCCRKNWRRRRRKKKKKKRPSFSCVRCVSWWAHRSRLSGLNRRFGFSLAQVCEQRLSCEKGRGAAVLEGFLWALGEEEEAGTEGWEGELAWKVSWQGP